MRTAVIYLMGVQYLGLNSLFVSVLQVLNLTELGVGSAMVYSMYKPISEDDKETICALMNLYRKYYRIIGLIIAVAGGILIPFVPKLISSDLPEEINIYVLYLLNLIATVLSYWMFAYKNSILQAYQRTDIVSKVTLITNTVKYILQIWVLWKYRNYYLYVIVSIATQILNNIVTAIVSDKLYPMYLPKGDIAKDEKENINKKIKDLFFIKIGSVVVDSVDTIVISAFLGLKALAIYQNYFYIMNSVYGMVGIVFTSIKAGVGNSLITESGEKNYRDFSTLTFVISYILCFCCACFICLYQPFMKI
jgi:O-antigen/teichoic acid export membrane protein